MTKIKLLFAFFCTFCLTSIAQTYNIGADYYYLGNYELAKKYFQKELAKNPAESNYYLGEIAFAEGKMDEAKSYYTKGLNADNNYRFNEVGLAKLMLKTNRKEAESTLSTLQKKYDKNADVTIAVGYAYFDNGLYEMAMTKVEDALKMEKKNPKVYILEGDILLKSTQNFGGAVSKYDLAIYHAPNYPLSYIKGAEIYENSNWQVAADKLKGIITLQPDYLIAYSYLGKLYNSNGYYPQAAEAYKTYFAGGNYTMDDILRYATALYFSKQYDDAKQIITTGLAIDPQNFVLSRLQMYIAAATNDQANGIKYAQHFFAIEKKERSEYLPKDYATYASILKDSKMYDDAIIQYQKALSLDSTYIELYQEMANTIAITGMQGHAADYYRVYIEKIGEKIEATDYYQLGRFYYSAANIRTLADTTALLKMLTHKDFLSKISDNNQQKDSLQKNQQMFVSKAVKYYLTEADKSFDVVIKLMPESFTGYLWKARTNSLLDPDSEVGLAKPYYEKTIDILLTKDTTTNSVKSTLIEAYSYLGYFYYLKNDNPNTLTYWNKVLELDPQNPNATAVLKTIKIK